MLTKSGAKLLDFGLAKTGAAAVAGSLSMLPTTPPGQTQPGTILGTFQYMAPEQLEGDEADARTDIFAFGAAAYETVTGKKAFEGKRSGESHCGNSRARASRNVLDPTADTARSRSCGRSMPREGP
jgi:serine/threonine protein kinase